MKLLSHLILLLVSIFILLWGIMMISSKGGGSIIFIVGLITTCYAIANTSILFLSMKIRGTKRKKLVLASGIINGIFFITWLVSSLDYGGLQQLEAPAIIILAIVGIANCFTVNQHY